MKREIGSFLELDLRKGEEYFGGENDIARLNSARAGIYHACRLLGCSSVLIPYYLCPSVNSFLTVHKINVEFYFINEDFEPREVVQKSGQAFLLVNYFGILSYDRMISLASRFKNVIIDNSAGFFFKPLNNLYSIYSPRKFFGVPDGGYVLGPEAERMTSEYDQDRSSDTSLFLLKRIEYGLTATYHERMINEERINKSGVLRMSILTNAILNNIDYVSIRQRRSENYLLAHEQLKSINLIDPLSICDDASVPMVYPLVLKDDLMTEKLKENNIYVGRLWKHVLGQVNESSFEALLSKYLVPVPIDQRYCSEEIISICKCISNLKN